MQIKRQMLRDLERIWNKIQNDRGAASALAALKRDRLNLAGIGVGPNSLPAIIASVPFLPNRRARSRVLPRPQGLRLTIRFLRELGNSLTLPFSRVEAYDARARVMYFPPSDELRPSSFLQATELLERVWSWRWVVTEQNPLVATIALLRWEIRRRTKKPHDRELIDLLDAAYRAAGFREGFPIELESFKKVERQERESRMAASRKLRQNRTS